MYTLILLLGLTAGSATDAAECRNPPSRASDNYWDFIDACGCENLDAPSKASQDHGRFLKACSQWRERNTRLNVVVSDPPRAASPTSAETSPADAAECRNPPSRVSAGYWDYIDACGCANLDPPSRASEDHGRFLKACSEWRERNPKVEVTVPATATPGP